MGIYKEYDIRGVVPSEINEKKAYEIGMAAAKFLESKTLIVGRDGRISSEKLKKALVRGITDYGVDVIDIGLVSTPIFYYANVKLKKRGIMVTASHNPKEYNGFKISDEKAIPFVYGTGVRRIGELAGKKIPCPGKKGKIARKSVVSSYLRHIKSKFEKSDFSGVSVVADFSNGAGAVAKGIFSRLKIRNKVICSKIDGRFPCHGPNPLIRGSAKMLGETVKKEKAGLGVILDGDADRVFFVDEKGNLVKTDCSFAILARDALRRRKGNVYYDLRFSRVVAEEIRRAGGTPVMKRVGSSYYKDAMRRKGGVISGEYSGHMMYRENHCIDDGIYAALRMMALLATEKKSLSEIAAPLMKYFSSDEISLSVSDKDNVFRAIEKKYSRNVVMFLDGISVYARDYWFNVRKSNTQPLIRLKIEATSKKILERMTERLKAEIKNAGKKQE